MRVHNMLDLIVYLYSNGYISSSYDLCLDEMNKTEKGLFFLFISLRH